jgi:1-acyl-sn-glycerol-3-phosphate acyltransferase
VKKVWRRIYSTYCLLVFALIFVFLLPFFFIFIQKKSWHKYALKLNRIWSHVYFTLCFIPVKIEWRFKPEKEQLYIFAPNHTSWFDIVIMGFLPKVFVFVGKVSIAKVPIFGYMYRKLHITVDRNSYRDRYRALVRAKEAIAEGKCIVMYPEGGIRTTNPPNMAPFKEGAFRIAIEQQIPVVPVTIPYNWIVLPEDGSLLVYRRSIKAIFHEPIKTAGMKVEEIDQLKEKTFRVIEEELRKIFPEEMKD